MWGFVWCPGEGTGERRKPLILYSLVFTFLFRTLEKMGLRKKVGIAEYQDYSSSSEEEDLLLSKPWMRGRGGLVVLSCLLRRSDTYLPYCNCDTMAEISKAVKNLICLCTSLTIFSKAILNCSNKSKIAVLFRSTYNSHTCGYFYSNLIMKCFQSCISFQRCLL